MVSPQLMQKFLEHLGAELDGDWIIVGGAVLALIGSRDRVTLDIDLVGPEQANTLQAMKVMEIAVRLGLPVEAINQAAAFFLFRIPHWRSQLIKVHQGTRATVYRPNCALFVALKIVRLSESDYCDCVRYIAYTVEKGELLVPEAIIKLCQERSATVTRVEQKQRLQGIITALHKIGG